MYKKDEVDAAINKVDKTIEDGVKYSNILNSEKDGNDNNDMSILAFERLYKRYVVLYYTNCTLYQ